MKTAFFIREKAVFNIKNISLIVSRIRQVIRQPVEQLRLCSRLIQQSSTWLNLPLPGSIICGAGFLLLGPWGFSVLAQEAADQKPSYDFQDVFLAFVLLGFLILVGRLIRQSIPLLQALFLPSSIVAGVVALLLGPSALGAIASSVAGKEFFLANGIFPPEVQAVWSAVPGVFINIVFAAIFLGEFIPSPREIWRVAAPQVAFGQTIAWGQYVVGLLLAITVLTPIFKLDPIAGALIEIAFEGGHGTAAGMAQTLTNLGFEAGPDLALGLATVGIVTGVLAGVFLANWGRKKGYIPTDYQGDVELEEASDGHPDQSPEAKAARARRARTLLIDPMSLHFGFVGLAIGIGWLILQALTFIESVTWNRGGNGLEILSAIPLFPLALVGGIIVQIVLTRLGRSYLINRQLMNRIGGVALDATIVTALASISLAVLGSNIGAFLVLSIAGILWNVIVFIYLAPRMIPTYWFERGIGDMGQSMGVTATGLLLMRMVDPSNRSGAFESFAYKQLFFEPIVGGGLFTAAAPPLINRFGPIPVLLLTSVILAFWLIFGLLNYRQITSSMEAKQG
ncbi:MAG: sodium:glutamate symporter [Symplocastrum torsivum CPER-KK1]|jgi:ESS family glutamate:Na+ symporter|uniref:Sodium:glutamate symporter n=1 Tax=Symplocastrum torsivum CPER-KK1 TaxID=450513 RepID=A0A951PKT0_9CYAN|nr:sodium:glutamate symporter [Symplocastrum torsivum CPER-KK1]